ncbi:MAG: peptidase [Burkholderiales bacterium]|nr:MAG: peptidase [Burkholderiales bacterium]
MSATSYPIGTPSQAWGAAEIELWRAKQIRKRSYADDVLSPLELLRDRFDVFSYGQVVYGQECFPLMATRSRDWRSDLPSVLITGGVHGYETSGVQGALRFLGEHALHFAGQINLLVAPCVSPWAYERVQRWNFDAIDPNRSFKAGSAAQECSALMRLIAPMQGSWAMHLDLHETTATDESEFRPALAARDGKPFEPGHIPDGFYAVCDMANPQLEFQSAIIAAVSRVTHIAQADDQGEMIGSPVIAPGVIAYELQALGLCASITGARYCTTTEVYPDSPRTTPEQCIAAQVAVVRAGIEFVLQAKAK